MKTKWEEDYETKILQAYVQHEPIFVEDWANALGISVWAFRRWWKKTAIKVSPHRFLTLRRFQRVKQYIAENPEASLKQIAIDNGFRDASYLYSWLTTHFPKIGTPSELKRQVNDKRLFFDLGRD